MDLENRLRRCKFRAWHRGTREADYMIGCFFDAKHAAWGDAETIRKRRKKRKAKKKKEKERKQKK